MILCPGTQKTYLDAQGVVCFGYCFSNVRGEFELFVKHNSHILFSGCSLKGALAWLHFVLEMWGVSANSEFCTFVRVVFHLPFVCPSFCSFRVFLE